jgi:hypothetical protein
MAQPDFLVIGAMKCATSTVCAYLEDHPEVFMVPNAEPSFFSHDDNWAKGADWYACFFAGRADERLCGEGSNHYAHAAVHPHAAGRIAEFCPDAKLIYMVRHPVQRIVASWVQKRVNQGDNIAPTLDRAVIEQPDAFIDESLYWRQLSQYRAHFPDDRIFIGFMEELKADAPAFMARLCAFLDIAPTAALERPHMNPSAGKRVPSELYTAVRRLPGIKALARLAPKGPKQWLKRRVFSTRLDARPAFSPQVLARLEAQIAPDAAAFLAHCGKPADHWRFETRPTETAMDGNGPTRHR